MKEKYYIFSQSEFLAMLLLAGGAGSTVGMSEEPVNAETLAEALTGLFTRGFITREGETFKPTGEGELFFEISRSKHTVVISAPAGRTAVCYVGTESIWVCELMTQGLRVKEWTRDGLAGWLIDAGLIGSPMLRDDDVGEMRALHDDAVTSGPQERILSLERYENGGELLGQYEIVRTGTVTSVIFKAGDEETRGFYTQEELERILDAAFSPRDI